MPHQRFQRFDFSSFGGNDLSRTVEIIPYFYSLIWRGHQTSPTVVSLKGRLPQKLQSTSTPFLRNCLDTQSVSSWFYKETEITI